MKIGPTSKALIFALVVAALRCAAVARAGAVTEEDQTFVSAEAAFKAHEDDEAARLYDKVLAINPARAEAYVMRSMIHYRRKEYPAAVAILRKAKEAVPGDVGIKAQLGLSLYRAGEKAEAVRLLEEVVAASPQSYQVQLQLGQHYLTTSDGKRAAQSFTAYFASRPEEAAGSDLQIRPLAGAAFVMSRKYVEAEREFEIVLKAKPGDVAARVALGAVYTGSGRCDKAIATYQGLLGEAAKQPTIHYNLATCYLRSQRATDAEKSARAFVSARPNDAKAWVLLGDVHHAAGATHDDKAALVELEKAVSLDPQSVAAKARLGRVYLDHKDNAAAVRLLEAGRAAAPAGTDLTEILARLAEAYAGAPNPPAPAVLVALAETLAKSGDADAVASAGLAFYATGDDGRAASAFESSLALDAHGDHTRRARVGLMMALNRAAIAEAGKGDLAGAQTTLERARAVAATNEASLRDLAGVVTGTARNLAIVHLLRNQPERAAKLLEGAMVPGNRDAAMHRLLGRAYAALHRPVDAARYYEWAIEFAREAGGSDERATGARLADKKAAGARWSAQIGAELGPVLVTDKRFDAALTRLEAALVDAGADPGAALVERNLAVASVTRAAARIAIGGESVAGAADDLTRALALPRGLRKAEATAARCSLALVALSVGKPARADELLHRAALDGGCQWNAPYERIGTEFFLAYAAYRGDPEHRQTAARSFGRLLPRAQGPLAERLRDLLRSGLELEAWDRYVHGDLVKAQAALAAAQKLPRPNIDSGLSGESGASAGGAGLENRTLVHNLAVLELARDHLAVAAPVFERLAGKPVESLVNLGIVRDRQGDSRRALDLYRKAREKGMHDARLKEWIDVKERLLASESSGGKAP